MIFISSKYTFSKYSASIIKYLLKFNFSLSALQDIYKIF